MTLRQENKCNGELPLLAESRNDVRPRGTTADVQLLDDLVGSHQHTRG